LELNLSLSLCFSLFLSLSVSLFLSLCFSLSISLSVSVSVYHQQQKYFDSELKNVEKFVLCKLYNLNQGDPMKHVFHQQRKQKPVLCVCVFVCLCLFVFVTLFQLTFDCIVFNSNPKIFGREPPDNAIEKNPCDFIAFGFC